MKNVNKILLVCMIFFSAGILINCKKSEINFDYIHKKISLYSEKYRHSKNINDAEKILNEYLSFINDKSVRRVKGMVYKHLELFIMVRLYLISKELKSIEKQKKYSQRIIELLMEKTSSTDQKKILKLRDGYCEVVSLLDKGNNVFWFMNSKIQEEYKNVTMETIRNRQ